jgi:cytochrome bd ubiquinol oxidase subunit II
VNGAPLHFGLPEFFAAVIVVALNVYVLSGGADFGGGVWDLFARGPRRLQQRDLIADTIGPIWEANHVWLVLVVVLSFTAFPPFYALLGTVLHLPLAMLLVGIVLRGSAFVFRSYGSRTGEQRRRWGRAFAIASTVTPLLLGVCVGAVASGRVGAVAGLATAGPFRVVYVAPWFAPFPLAVGVMALALFAMLAAVYLTLETTDRALQEDFRRRALAAAGAVFVAAFGTLAIAHHEAPLLRDGLVASPWALPFQIATGVAAVAAIGALWTRRYRAARIAAAAQVSLILWGWAAAQYPYLVPRVLTIEDAAAARVTLRLVAGALGAGAVLLIPSLVYLRRTFSVRRRSTPPPDA